MNEFEWTRHCSAAVTDTFLFLWLDELGASRLLMGLALCFTCLSEVLVFRYEDRIKRALSTEWCVALILVCYGVRQTFYAVLPAFNNPWARERSSFIHPTPPHTVKTRPHYLVCFKPLCARTNVFIVCFKPISAHQCLHVVYEATATCI